MAAPARKQLRGKLAIKYLMVMLPLFLACMSAGLFYISKHNAQSANDELNARLGMQTASMASTIEQLLVSSDLKTSQKMLNKLLSDRAVDCAEVIDRRNLSRSIKSPQGLGCRGIDDANVVDIAMSEEIGATLHVRYNTNEVAAVVRAQRDFTLLALLASLVIAIAASAVGFELMIGRPLRHLRAAIKQSSKDGKKSQVSLIPNDELGEVILAYNEMQTRLAADAKGLADEVEQRRETEQQLLVANQDVESARVLLEQQFQKIELQRNELRTILDNMPHSVVWLDADWNIKMRSRRVTEVHCMEEDEYDGVKTLYDHVRIVAHRGDIGPYSDQNELDALIRSRVETLTTIANINETVRIHFPTKDRWMQVRAASLPDGGCILGQSDITDQVAAEQSVEQARSQLEEANSALEKRVEERTEELVTLQGSLVEAERHATYGKLTSKICHELRNPLNALSLVLHVFRIRFGNDPKLASLFARSDRSVQRCAGILDDFHDFALTDSVDLEIVDVCDWTREQIRQIDVPDEVGMEVQIADGPLLCAIDRMELAKAFAKIAKNAVQAVTDERHSGELRQVSVWLERVGTDVQIEVIDSGVGMCTETADEALQPLFSTRNFGVGLGLPIAKQSFERHGGGLNIDSQPGNRTIITMRLPLAHLDTLASPSQHLSHDRQSHILGGA